MITTLEKGRVGGTGTDRPDFVDGERSGEGGGRSIRAAEIKNRENGDGGSWEKVKKEPRSSHGGKTKKLKLKLKIKNVAVLLRGLWNYGICILRVVVVL